MEQEQQDITHEISRLAEPVARSLGLAIWGVEIIPSGRMTARIYVDTPPGTDGGPSIEQCATISRHVSLALEAGDVISHAYVLEVSSPGLERPFFALAQLAPYTGSVLELKLSGGHPELPNRKHLRGRLLALGENAFTMLVCDAPEETRLSISWDNVRKATLAPELPFTNRAKPGKRKSASRADSVSK